MYRFTQLRRNNRTARIKRGQRPKSYNSAPGSRIDPIPVFDHRGQIVAYKHLHPTKGRRQNRAVY